MTTAGHEPGTRTRSSTTGPAAARCSTWARTTCPRWCTCSGPVVKVTGAASTPRAEREIGSGPRAGQRFPVEVDTHVTGVLEHAGGALSTLVMSFDIHAAHLPRIEVHGTEGSLSVPDPNGFEGPVELFARRRRWQPLPVSAGYPGAGRGTGLADLADARRGRPAAPGVGRTRRARPRRDAHAARRGARGRALPVASTCERPAPVAGALTG